MARYYFSDNSSEIHLEGCKKVKLTDTECVFIGEFDTTEEAIIAARRLIFTDIYLCKDCFTSKSASA